MIIFMFNLNLMICKTIKVVLINLLRNLNVSKTYRNYFFSLIFPIPQKKSFILRV